MKKHIPLITFLYLTISVLPLYAAGQPVMGSEIAQSKPAIYNVTLTSADTEYSQSMTNIHTLKFHARTDVAVRYAYVTGKVATPTAPYMTLKAGQVFSMYNVSVSSMTIYLGSATAGTVVELTKW